MRMTKKVCSFHPLSELAVIKKYVCTEKILQWKFHAAGFKSGCLLGDYPITVPKTFPLSNKNSIWKIVQVIKEIECCIKERTERVKGGSIQRGTGKLQGTGPFFRQYLLSFAR